MFNLDETATKINPSLALSYFMTMECYYDTNSKILKKNNVTNNDRLTED